jgi:hypothetical protein
MRKIPIHAAAALILLAAPAAAQRAVVLPLKLPPQPTTPAITVPDLMTRVYAFADDSLMGRAAGTVHNLRGAALIERELRRLGLQPGGENGTYFQDVPLVRRALEADTDLTVDGTPLRAWTDFVPRDQGPGMRPVDGVQVVFGGTWGGSLIGPDQARGKLVLLDAPRGSDGQPTWNLSRSAVNARFPEAAAVAVATVDLLPPEVLDVYREPSVTVGGDEAPTLPTFLYVSRAAAARLLGRPLQGAVQGHAGGTVRGAVRFSESRVPGRNVVAVLPGSDPVLRGQFVALGAHNDHDAPAGRAVDHDSLRSYNRVVRPGGVESEDVRPTRAQLALVAATLDSLRRLRPARADSIYNGADDDASGSMALLEIAEAFASMPQRPRRSMLFVWHTAEELGMVGSTYFTEHPTVPLDSVVAHLNMDMIGRGAASDFAGGGPRYLQLIGSRRLSTELGDLVEAVNRAQTEPFEIDYSFDADGHPQNFYCRSDHWLYARQGIPITFFSAGGHADYHMVTDEPQYLDYDRYRRITQLIHDVALQLANRAAAPVRDRPRPDPDAPCRQ